MMKATLLFVAFPPDQSQTTSLCKFKSTTSLTQRRANNSVSITTAFCQISDVPRETNKNYK